jgi:hypothetical protein
MVHDTLSSTLLKIAPAVLNLPELRWLSLTRSGAKGYRLHNTTELGSVVLGLSLAVGRRHYCSRSKLKVSHGMVHVDNPASSFDNDSPETRSRTM